MTEREPPRSSSRELTTDYLYDYPGYSNCASRCRVRLYGAPDLTPIFLLEELQDNPGTSITNMAEYLAAELATRHCPERLETAEPFHWIERYPRTESEKRRGMVEYSLVQTSSEPRGSCSLSLMCSMVLLALVGQFLLRAQLLRIPRTSPAKSPANRTNSKQHPWTPITFD